MSYKRSRSPSGGGGAGDYPARNVRGRGSDYQYDQYESPRNQSYSRNGSNPPSGQYDYGGGGGGRHWATPTGGGGGSGSRRSYPDFGSDAYEDNFNPRGGGGGHLQSWSVSTDSWSGGSGRRSGGGAGSYQQSPQFVPNPMYNPSSAGVSRSGGHGDWRRSNGGGGGFDDNRGRRSDVGYGHRNDGGGGRYSNSGSAEQRRLEISSQSRVLFLEEANLPPKFAFRLDNSSDTQLLSTESTGHNEKPNFFPTFYRDNVLGATEEYIKKNNIRSYLSKKDDDEEVTEEVDLEPQSPPPPGTSPVTPRVSSAKTMPYISMGSSKRRLERDRELNDTKQELTTDEKREHFNIITRQNPENVQMWREFVLFQDEDCINMKRKARIEKKIAILETALRTNPRSSELHFDRLDLLNEILKSSDVLVEWEKLAQANEDSESIWIERFKYVSTQLQLYSSSNLNKEFLKGFEKLRRMLSPSYPSAHPKPVKVHLLLPDLLLALSLLLKNSGHMEKAIALSQAQLEFNFNFPEEGHKLGSDKSGWKEIIKLFELFWNLETLRFGEPGYEAGWGEILKNNPELLKDQKAQPIGLQDSLAVEFEDKFFEGLNESDMTEVTRSEWNLSKSSKWILIESLRSKFYWTPWRSRASDVSDCEDPLRIISSEDVSPHLIQIPSTVSSFDQQSAYFRHTLNYLLLLAHDFLPRTHTLDSILSPFSSLSLTDSATFFSELNYWEKLTEFYHAKEGHSNVEAIPEGFQLAEYMIPCSSTIILSGKKLNLVPPNSDSVSQSQQSLLDENQLKYHTLIRSVVTQALEHLNPEFASLLVQLLLRYEQKSMYGRSEQHKEIVSFCKNLMKHEKVRACVGVYLEIGLLEYFGGRKKKAISLLHKTLTSSSVTLRERCTEGDCHPGQGDKHGEGTLEGLLSSWEIVASVTKLYRLLAEFHLRDNRPQALSILTSLGNQFDTVSMPAAQGEGDSEASQGQPLSKHMILKAKRFFENMLNHLVPKGLEKDESLIEIDCEENDNLAPEFEKWDGINCLEYFGQKTNLIVEWTLAYSLFAYLSEETFEAASEVFGRVMDKLRVLEPLSRSNKYSPAIVNGHNIREQLYIGWCKLGALHVTLNPMQNSKFRNVFGKALELYPSSPPLLLLYMNVESQCSVVGKLWRSMVNTVKDPSPNDFCTLDWAPIFMSYGLAKQIEEIEQDSEIALDEFGIGGPAVPPDTIFYKLDAILTAAENNLLTRSCPLIWRLHLKNLAIRAKEGKDERRAHGLFYEAIRRCPSSKALYMDAILYFPEMMTEVMELMSQNEVTVRMPLEELDLLLQFNGKEDEHPHEPPPDEPKDKSRKKKKRKRAKKSNNSEEDDVVAIEILSD